MSINAITLSDEELKNLSVGESIEIDFDERDSIPQRAYLKNLDGDIKGIAEKQKGPMYLGGRMFVYYLIASIE